MLLRQILFICTQVVWIITKGTSPSFHPKLHSLTKLLSRNFTQFYSTKSERDRNLRKEYETQMEYRKHLQAFIDRWRYNANRAAQAQSKIKILEKVGFLLRPLSPKTHYFFRSCPNCIRRRLRKQRHSNSLKQKRFHLLSCSWMKLHSDTHPTRFYSRVSTSMSVLTRG